MRSLSLEDMSQIVGGFDTQGEDFHEPGPNKADTDELVNEPKIGPDLRDAQNDIPFPND